MNTVRPELTAVAGVPETLLSQVLLASLPPNDAPAPWTLECSAVLWFARARASARDALPEPVRRTGAAPVLVVGGFVRYDETPVGPYDEVLGMVGSRSGRSVRGAVCFMAVDSRSSLVGGRDNWGMPKALAAFEGGVGSGERFAARSADHDAPLSWSVSAVPRAAGPIVPARGRATCRQVLGDGSLVDSRLSARARVRAAKVDVEVASVPQPPRDAPASATTTPAGSIRLPDWLRPGPHAGLVVESCTFTLAAPTPAR